MDEEMYPGCGALKTGKKIEQVVLTGVYVAPFASKENIAQLHPKSCQVLCPCSSPAAGCKYDIPGYKGYDVDKCTNEDFAAYTECKGAYNKPTASAWKNMYSSYSKGAQYSQPIMFQIDSIKVTPYTAEQVTYLTAHCACKSWKKGSASDISKCTNTNCDYLTAKGLFAVTPDYNCVSKSKRCLFAAVYRHQQLYLYVSRAQPTLAQVIKSPIYSDGIYTLKNVKSCGTSDASSIQTSILFTAAAAIIVSLLAHH